MELHGIQSMGFQGNASSSRCPWNFMELETNILNLIYEDTGVPSQNCLGGGSTLDYVLLLFRASRRRCLPSTIAFLAPGSGMVPTAFLAPGSGMVRLMHGFHALHGVPWNLYGASTSKGVLGYLKGLSCERLAPSLESLLGRFECILWA